MIIDHVNILLPVPTTTVSGNTSCTLRDAMRGALADTINLQLLPIRSTNFADATTTSIRYYIIMRAHLQSRFNMRLVPVIGRVGSDYDCNHLKIVQFFSQVNLANCIQLRIGDTA